MISHRHVTPILLFVLLVSAGCTKDLAWEGVLRGIDTQFPEVERISTDSLASWMAADSVQQPVLLDSRGADEYSVSHLRGAVRIDPDATEFAELDTLARDAPVVVYCSVGFRSSAIASRLQRAGFTNVHNLEGSIFRWANEGRPVYLDGREVNAVHPYDAAWGRLLDDDLHAR